MSREGHLIAAARRKDGKGCAGRGLGAVASCGEAGLLQFFSVQEHAFMPRVAVVSHGCFL